MRLFSSEHAHWYRPNGEPMHYVQNAAGAPEITRPTTLRDARKLGLLPSVTNVLGVISKPELAEWKMTQAVLAALTLPRRPGEPEDEFAKRVVADSQSRVKTAADFGTAFHSGAERLARGLGLDAASPCAEWLREYQRWFEANCSRVLWTERVLVSNEHGYAGTADLLVEHQQHGLTLVDYKTQGLKPGSKPRFYNSWCQQLAAYRSALGRPVHCLNLVINSAASVEPVEHLWTEEDLRAGWDSFAAALVIWRNEKGYDPRQMLRVESSQMVES